MSHVMLTVFVVAELTESTERTVRRWFYAGKIEGERQSRGKNAKAILIDVDSLPPAARAKYYEQNSSLALAVAGDSRAPGQGEVDAALDGDLQSTILSSTRYVAAADRVRERADRRMEAVESFGTAVTSQIHKRIGEAERLWLRRFRLEHPGFAVSLSSVKRWTAAYRERGLDGVVDCHSGVGRKLSIPAEVQDEFRAVYLQPTRPTVAICHKLLRKIAIVRGWGMLPGYGCFKRLAASIPKTTKLFYRHPTKTQSAIRPHVLRSYEGDQAMRVIQSDHHQIDVAVSCGDPACGAGHYPWLTIWIDVRSRMVLGADLFIEPPNSRHILDLLYRVYIQYGLSEYVFVDNGMDYRKAFGAWGTKHFSPGRVEAKFHRVAGWDETQLGRVFAPLGVKAIFANAYNAQSKIVERFFRTLKDALYTAFPSYRGGLGQRSERAEWLRRHPEELPELGAFAEVLECTVAEYNEEPHRGEGMRGDSPRQVFEDTRIPERRPDAKALAIAFWEQSIATVQKTGIRFRHNWYRIESVQVQHKYLGKQIVIRFHPSRLEQLVVSDGAGMFLALATMRGYATNNSADVATKQAIAESRADWREVKRLVRQENPAGAKRLDQQHLEIEEYYRRRIAQAAAVPQIAAAGGASGGVVQMLPYESQMARQVESAIARSSNPSGLTPEQLASIADCSPDDHSAEDEYLERMERKFGPNLRPMGVKEEPREEEEPIPDNPFAIAAQREISRAAFERNTRLRKGLCLTCGAAAAPRGRYCLAHRTEREERRGEGLCMTCGEERAQGRDGYCSQHLSDRLEDF
jgi:Mu DNA binding, I gamma subdomain/Mu transposase, C-terminal